MSDYKEGIQRIADDIASELYGLDFYELDDEKQDKVYERAQEIYWEGKFSEADGRR